MEFIVLSAKKHLSIVGEKHEKNERKCSIRLKGVPHGAVVNVLDYDIVVNEFKLQALHSLLY